jgi:RNA 3'-terminal phosphate cyclase (ATP)
MSSYVANEKRGNATMIEIDGSFGEGGGQILRTSLALSLVTGKPFRIRNIRAARKKPGLMRQHLTAVNAAAEIGEAKTKGATIGSGELEFEPRSIKAGKFHFAIGSAGSCTLVLQTILPALIQADGPSEIVLEGGTHNPFAPPYDFLEKAFIPAICGMGPRVSAALERPGFYPAGGGKFKVSVSPVKKLTGPRLVQRGPIRAKRARATVSCLSPKIARRELKVAAERLELDRDCLEVVEIQNTRGPGNVLVVEVESEHVTEIFTGFGQKGVTAEKVAEGTVRQVREYLAAGVPVGKYLADQLTAPMAMAGEGVFRTISPTRHTLTNIEIVKRFLDVAIFCEQYGKNSWEIGIGSNPVSGSLGQKLVNENGMG